jgi:streptogramin lyase
VDSLAPRRLASVLGFVLVLALGLAATASAAPAVNGTFPVPGIETNNKIVAGPDGNMWVTVRSGADDVARITPSGEVKEFELEGVNEATGIAVAPNGTMWVTYVNGVAEFSVADPKKTSNATPLAITGAESIVAGPDGKMWVGATNLVFNFAPSAPATPKEFPIAGLTSKDIDVAGSLIVVADSTNVEPKPKVLTSRLLTFTTAGAPGTIVTPGGSQGLAGSPSGQIAFSAPGALPEQSGLVTPPNPAQSFELLGDPQGVALGSDQAFWIAQFTPGELERVTPSGARSTLGGLPKASIRQIAAGPGNTLWVTLSAAGAEGVVRISGLEPPRPTDIAPQTTIAKGPRKVVKTRRRTAKVSFRFESNLAGSSFECALIKLGRKHGKPVFRACKSPKAYRLRPGRYSFSVRAVSVGVADPTPATRSFRVVRVHRRHHRHHR